MQEAKFFMKSHIHTYLEQYMEKVFYFSLKKTGTQQEAEDLSSDIFLCILTQLQRGVIPENFSAWVWRIARNRYSAWADQKHRKAAMISNADISDFELTDDKTIENEYVRSEELSLLRRELAFISSNYREIVVAYYVDDKPIRDIARTLQLTEGAVKMRLLRARNILKEGMRMARKFGIKSYNPEDVHFAASGSQPSGLPWCAVERKIPKNILLQASNNPSTVEELSVELGVAVPYLEEEVALLVHATLLKKTGDKYVTNFFIADKECQLDMYTAQRQNSKERSDRIDKIADDIISVVKTMDIVRNGMADSELKWWVVIHIVDFCIAALREYNISWPEKRENGETWGFIGFENTVLPENCGMGHNGNGSENAMFWSYKISDYNMWDRVGEMEYNQVLLLADMIRNKRNLSTLTPLEKEIWNRINGRFAHIGENGSVIPDVLVFENNTIKKINDAITKHALYNDVMQNIKIAFDNTVNILKKSSIDVLHHQLAYYASMQILQIRMMTVHDEVERNRLTVPKNPEKSTVAMFLVIQ